MALSREISEILIGEDCLLRFVDPQGRVNPEVVVGKLRRMEEEGQYTIEFDKPLEGLRMWRTESRTSPQEKARRREAPGFP